MRLLYPLDTMKFLYTPANNEISVLSRIIEEDIPTSYHEVFIPTKRNATSVPIRYNEIPVHTANNEISVPSRITEEDIPTRYHEVFIPTKRNVILTIPYRNP